MKKLFLLTLAILMISNMAFACGGIIVKDKYCMSKHTMNWYSASAWCQAQGMQLADVKTECKTLSSCTALMLSSTEQSDITNAGGKVGTVWMYTSEHIHRAYIVKLSTGSFDSPNYAYREYNSAYAFCK